MTIGKLAILIKQIDDMDLSFNEFEKLISDLEDLKYIEQLKEEKQAEIDYKEKIDSLG